MVTYGDAVSNVNIAKLYTFHKMQNTVGTVTGVFPPSRFGDLVSNGNIVQSFNEKLMDTFDKEPPENIHLLSRAGKTVLTPHVAGTTEESFKRMGVDAAKNVLTILKGEKPDKRCVVNPEVFEGE